MVGGSDAFKSSVWNSKECIDTRSRWEKGWDEELFVCWNDCLESMACCSMGALDTNFWVVWLL